MRCCRTCGTSRDVLPPAPGILEALHDALARTILRSEAGPMTEENDIWRAAHLLVKHHGDDAWVVAAQRADESIASGDLDGQMIWKRIVAAITELQRTKPAPGERRN